MERLPAVDAATAFVNRHFPVCSVALLVGSVGAWLLRSLREDDPALADAFTHALGALYRHDQKDPLLRFAEDALALVGGRRFEGYGEEW